VVYPANPIRHQLKGRSGLALSHLNLPRARAPLPPSEAPVHTTQGCGSRELDMQVTSCDQHVSPRVRRLVVHTHPASVEPTTNRQPAGLRRHGAASRAAGRALARRAALSCLQGASVGVRRRNDSIGGQEAACDIPRSKHPTLLTLCLIFLLRLFSRLMRFFLHFARICRRCERGDQHEYRICVDSEQSSAIDWQPW